jgi:multicomponent Na+:H+ antiporter subunit E
MRSLEPLRTLRAATLFVLLLGFWFLLSGKVEGLFLGMGLIAALIVTWLSVPLLEDVLGRAVDTPRIDLLHLAGYLLWLVSRIPPAGIDVALSVLVPARKPQPGVVRFRTGLHSPAARTLLANSITLVPGTMTLEVDGGDFIVHALNPKAAEDLATGEMQRRIARVFRLTPDAPPVMRWDPVRLALPREEDE